MRINALGKNEKSVGKAFQRWNDHPGVDMEIEVKTGWILSIIGALSIAGILLASEWIR